MSHARSHTRIVVHYVWSTRKRVHHLTPDRDAWLAERITRIAEDAGCTMVAAGNASEHVHVLVRLASTISVSELARLMKGVTSRMWNLEFPGRSVSWQDGFWAESRSPADLDELIRYIRDQRQHHAIGRVRGYWEPAR